MNARLSIKWARWLWPSASLITLVGYFRPWVPHRVAGLAILGLDLGEYVKFLPPGDRGGIPIWREGFYVPLFAVALACSLLSHRRAYAYPFWLRLALVLLGVIATLNMLPPAWSPAVLRTPEFRLQTVAIVASLVLLALSPVLALLPSLLTYTFIAVISAAGIWFPLSGFLQALPRISALYGHALRPGWALILTVAGLLLLLVTSWIGYRLEAITQR